MSSLSSSASSRPVDISWDEIDKTRFFGYGTVAFTSLTMALFPLSVVKTKLQVLEGAKQIGVNPLTAMARTFRTTLQADGIRGLYKGFGTVAAGALPARIIYMSTLESSKQRVSQFASNYSLSPVTTAALASAIGGLTASLATQSVTVPMDVISSRMMIQGSRVSGGEIHQAQVGGSSTSTNCTSSSGSGSGGLATARARASHSMARGMSQGRMYSGPIDAIRQIIAAEGVRGLYRGLPASLMTYAPSSAIWWSSYSVYNRTIWDIADRTWPSLDQADRSSVFAKSIQAFAGLLAGTTSGALTNPLDVIKTRVQVLETTGSDGARPTVTNVAQQLWREEGAAGFLRGIGPRVTSVAVWGTSMVLCYEELKNLARKER